MTKKLLLMILDGWGISPEPKVSAIDQANTPFMRSLPNIYPFSKLKTDGLAVGLPEGQMGNSEVGHTNIGAGRVVYQNLVRVNLAIEQNTLSKNETLQAAFAYAQKEGKKVHFIGLVSDGGVHSHISHLIALCKIAAESGITHTYIHAFTDGRDTDPQSGKAFMQHLIENTEIYGAKVATVIGRYYAMDRDRRWERVKLAYDCMVKSKGESTENVIDTIAKSYQDGITDEFIKPLVCTENQKTIAKIEEGDVVISFNFRTDRCREITQVLSQMDFPAFEMKKMPLHYITMTQYDQSFENVGILFDEQNLNNTLGEVLEKAGKKQIRMAETEKYPHVTFFFSGGRETPFEGEKRIMCPSPKVATYDLQPEMSAFDLRDAILPELEKAEADFICLNFANTDMVGHTGDFQAVVRACEVVDSCAKTVAEKALANGYAVIITADHGNADNMINTDGTPNTAHSLNLVPCLFLTNDFKGTLKNGKLADLAPSILDYLELQKPKEMDGESLLVRG